MCGIVGFTGSFDNSESVLLAMMNRIAHRGPDAEGRFANEYINLGFRRLSIIDLDPAATAPLFNEDKTLAVMLNGEIYNYRELREELSKNGHTFRTRTDTEVLVHLYEEHREGMLEFLRGMFAFVIYDIENNTLFAARDFFGIKPFYYTQIDGRLVFASEIKAFLEYPGFKPQLNEQALAQYLSFQYSVLPETFFKGVYRLQPGNFLRYENGRLTIHEYFSATFAPQITRADKSGIDCAADELERVIKDSIQAHKIADVPVGSFLSSGVDSSYIAVVAGVDKTFTVGFSFDDYNEISYAARLTNWHKQTSGEGAFDNHPRTITDEEYWDVLPKIQYHMDEPQADPSSVALYFVSEAAARHVKVALSGEGADEFFGGYNIYKEPLDLRAVTRLPKAVRRSLAKAAQAVPFRFKGKNFLRRAATPLQNRFIGNAYIFTKKERDRVLKCDKASLPHEITRPFYENASGLDDITKMQFIDTHFWLPGDILQKADRMSMAHSLEVRVPFLDKHVFDAARKLPTAYKVSKRGTKLAFRKAAARRLPQDVADKKKLGFPVPIRLWLREQKYYERVKEAFTSPIAGRYFYCSALMELLDRHFTKKADNSRKIWTVYMFLVWYEQFF